MSTPVASFFLVFMIARRLGTSGLGEYSTALSLYAIFQSVCSLGFNLLITKEVAQDGRKVNKYLVNCSFLGVVFSLAAAALMCVAATWITESPAVRHSIYILGASLAFFSVATVCHSISTAFEKLEYVMIPTIAGNMVKLLLGTYILYRGFGIVVLMMVILLSQFINFILSAYYAYKFATAPLGKINIKFCKLVVTAVPIYSIIVIFATIRANVNVLLLTKMLGFEHAGYYSAVYKLVDIFKLGLSAYIMALQPVVFRSFSLEAERFKRICVESIKYLTIIVLPVIVLSIIFSDRIVLLVYKEKFLPASSALHIMIWILLFYSVNQILAHALIGGNNPGKNLEANVIGLACNILLNVILIPHYSFMGAAFAMTFSVFLVALLQYYYVTRKLFSFNILKNLKKPLLSAVIMSGVAFLLKHTNPVIIGFASLLTYSFFLLVLKTFSQKDAEILLAIWRRRNVYDNNPG